MGENVRVTLFLDPEWIDALAQALDGASQPSGPGSDGVPNLNIRHCVKGGPRGDVEFGLELGPDGPRIHRGPIASTDADVEVVQDYATAAAISQGAITPAAAFASGRVRMGGRVGLLTQHREGLSRFGEALAALRESTSY